MREREQVRVGGREAASVHLKTTPLLHTHVPYTVYDDDMQHNMQHMHHQTHKKAQRRHSAPLSFAPEEVHRLRRLRGRPTVFHVKPHQLARLRCRLRFAADLAHSGTLKVLRNCQVRPRLRLDALDVGPPATHHRAHLAADLDSLHYSLGWRRDTRR